MANLTKDGICYNLKETPYTHVINYGDEQINYHFSSMIYKLKFISKQKDNREKINLSLTNRFGFEIKNNLLCDLKLYSQIEKRGFLIVNVEGEIIQWRKSITLDGQRVIAKI